jgi:hypothetical protein
VDDFQGWKKPEPIAHLRNPWSKKAPSNANPLSDNSKKPQVILWKAKVFLNAEAFE